MSREHLHHIMSTNYLDQYCNSFSLPAATVVPSSVVPIKYTSLKIHKYIVQFLKKAKIIYVNSCSSHLQRDS